MKSTKQKDWEEEFFEKFTEKHDGGVDAGEFAVWIEKDPLRVWFFIESLLQGERKKIVSRVFEDIEKELQDARQFYLQGHRVTDDLEVSEDIIEELKSKYLSPEKK